MDSALRDLPSRPSLKAWAALAVILIAGFYLLTIFLAGSCVFVPYWFLTQEEGGIQTLLLLVAGLVIAATLLWSVIPRRQKFTAPGPRLEASSHPRLFGEVERLAATLGEPMPGEIYIIPAVNAGVTVRGGVMGFGSLRVMLLGLPLLEILTLSQFRAVLAHEFGHYYGGDTKLGPWVYKTRVAMVRALLGLGQPNAALSAFTRIAVVGVVYVVITKVLVGYWNLFLRMTQLISRRQENRADELACFVTGSQALIDGLRRIHGATAALPAYQNALAQVLSAGFRPAVAEGFARFMAAPAIAQAVSTQIEKDLKEGRTKPFDSHPPLRERIARARKLPPGEPLDNDPAAITLLDDVTSVEMQLLQHLNPKQRVAELKAASWEKLGTEVWLPQWRHSAEEYVALLQGITVGSLPEAVKGLKKMGSQIRDPKGMLLSPEQRTQRAAGLLGTAFALALVQAGWELHAGPGVLHLNHGTDELNPFQTIQQLASGTVAAGSWIERSKALGIEGLPLSPASAHPETGAPQPSQSSESSHP